MRASRRSPFTFVALPLVACLSVVPAPAVAGPYDGSRPFLCAVTTVMECDGSGQCERHIDDASSVPTFIRIDVGAQTVTAGTSRRTTLRSATRLDGQLILQGGENGRGWSATIEEETGRMAAAIVDNDHTFSIFGGCTIP
jgi:hypothetical protein